MEKQKITYKRAGVDIDAGESLVARIKPLLKTTARAGCNAQIGGFASAIDIKKLNYKDPIFFHTSDGVGTKLKLAQHVNFHNNIGIDLVAMNVNDLLVHGAEPISFLDYFATGQLLVDQAEMVISGIVEGCKQSNCALSGGETAEMAGMYQNGEYDLAGFALGVVERDQILPKINEIMVGDVVLGLASSGIHSNGYSLVRYLIDENNIDLFAPPPFESQKKYLWQVLLEPTKIYVQSLLPLIKNNQIKALAHITGGGLLENIPRILPENVSLELDMRLWKVPPIFNWLATLGNIDSTEMLRTFNCGIGMIAIVSSHIAESALATLRQHETVSVIGQVIDRCTNRVLINNKNELNKKGKCYGTNKP